jgi:serine protease AprX
MRNRSTALLVVFAIGGAFGIAGARPPVVGSVIAPAFAARLAANPSALTNALVTLASAPGAGDVAALRSAGVTPIRIFDAFGVVYVAGSGRALLGLRDLNGVARISENAKLEFFGDTDTVATRARDAWDAKSTSVATQAKVAGSVINGSGVGVAVVDSGIDFNHPDLTSARVVNKKFVCTTPGLVDQSTGICFGNRLADTFRGIPVTGCTNDYWVDQADTDVTSGHGTHVAGIVAGRGLASDSRFTGAAPGAKLYGLGVGEAESILSALEAFNWIHCNYNLVNPVIRVVNNSWGVVGGSEYILTDPIVVATNTLVNDKIAVLFAVGNDGSAGGANTISGYAKNPKPGVIGVANYDDEGTATRAGTIAADSSRGASDDTDKAAWPDVAAPGTGIVSTAARTGVVIPSGLEPAYEPYYTRASGTSMATPQVAGVLAELFQAKPALTPADAEDVLEDHAAKIASAGTYVADNRNPTTQINLAAGHGLIDAIASLHDARVGATGGSALPQLSQDPHVAIGADVQFVSGMQWTIARTMQVTMSERGLRTGDAAAYPLAPNQAARVVVNRIGVSTTNLTTHVSTDPNGGFMVQASFTFVSPATYVIEPQVSFGGVYKAFDSFVIRVI